MTSVVFAEVAAVGGIVLSLAPGVPVSVFVATISFLIYLFCWLLGRRSSVRQRLSLSNCNGPSRVGNDAFGSRTEGSHVRQQIAAAFAAGARARWPPDAPTIVSGKAVTRRHVRPIRRIAA